MMRDKIDNANVAYVVGCFSRGRIFSEHRKVEAARRMLQQNECLADDDYAVYTHEEWDRGNVVPRFPARTWPDEGKCRLALLDIIKLIEGNGEGTPSVAEEAIHKIAIMALGEDI